MRQLPLIDFFTNHYVTAKIGLSPGTIDQYRCSIKSFERCLGRTAICEDLTNQQISAWLTSLAASRSPSTVNSKRRGLVALARFYNKSNGLAVPEVARCKELRRLPEAWVQNEVEGLLCSCCNQPGSIEGIPASLWWFCSALLVYVTSIRIGTLLRVETFDVNVREGFLIARAVPHTKQHFDQIFWLNDQAIEAVSVLMTAGNQRRRSLLPWPYSRAYLWRRFRQIVERAGLKASTRGTDLYHRLRRTNISYTAAKNIDAAVRQAGHMDAKTTFNHYIDERISRRVTSADLIPRLNLPLYPQAIVSSRKTLDSAAG